jgi:tRNA(Arg) A34 adenosine deaminase TadA
MTASEIRIALPAWVAESIADDATYPDAPARMRVALEAARQNVLRGTGGPFGAAVFAAAGGRLVAVGVNLVVPLHNSVLHAELVAFMLAQQRLRSHTLADGGAEHELYTSCEPCAMCLGATLWSGVRRVVWSATRADASRLRFDEGPVFPASYEYLRARGIAFQGGLLRADGRAVLELYRERGGSIYNG